MFFAPSNSRKRNQILHRGVSKTSHHIQIKTKMPNPSQEPSAPTRAQNQDLKDIDFFAPSKSRKRAKLWNMGVSKTNEHIQIKIKMLNTSQEPSAISETPNGDLVDIDVFCTFRIKMES